MFSKLSAPIALLGLMILATTARADLIQLANGDRLTGTIASIDGSSVVIDTDWGGAIVVDREAVQALTADGPMNLVVDGEVLQGARLSAAPSGEQIVTSPAGVREVGFGAVSLGSVDVLPQAAKDDWKTTLTYGLNVTTGNSDTETHSARVNSALRSGDYRHTGKAEFDRKVDDGAITKDQKRIGYQLDWFFRDDWYAYATSEYFADDVKDVPYRVTLGVGAGHQFWEDSLGALSAEAGMSAVIEEIGGENEENPAMRFALDYNRLLYGQRLEFFHNNELLVLTDFDRGQILNASTGLNFKMSSVWTANMRIDVVHETEPAPGQEKTDVTYILGVGFTL
ncbi:MAG TPA: DUF481 domain-containing protein [Pseudomonadales bacterium]|nr:DUF481 domain-containing protein [Pseudomonadales bacterium]